MFRPLDSGGGEGEGYRNNSIEISEKYLAIQFHNINQGQCRRFRIAGSIISKLLNDCPNESFEHALFGNISLSWTSFGYRDHYLFITLVKLYLQMG